MILTAHQPVYLPWLGLFHKIALADTFVSFNRVQYLPRDWNNRNKIKTANGPIWLTVPVLTTGHRDKAIGDIEINNSLPWREKHWKSICLNYKKTQYFDKYAPFLKNVYEKEWKYLTALNEYMLKYFLEVLGIRTNFLDASDYDFKGRKNGLVLDMCRNLKADIYIFGALGKDYADEKEFMESGIDVIFQEYNHPIYRQLHGEFTPYMSIIDLLFNCGDEALDIIMSNNIKRTDLVKAELS